MSAKRLVVSLEEGVLDEINELAKYNHQSASKVARELIKSSLELQEDKMFSKLADERLKNSKKWISHNDTWK